MNKDKANKIARTREGIIDPKFYSVYKLHARKMEEAHNMEKEKARIMDKEKRKEKMQKPGGQVTQHYGLDSKSRFQSNDTSTLQST